MLAIVLIKFPLFVAFKAPIHSPTNITAFNKSSTSLQVTWVTIPTKQGIGKVTGYIIVFFAIKDGNSTAQNVSVTSGNLNETTLVGLQKFSNYSIQILGFTDVDKLGPLSDPVHAMTGQDGKSSEEDTGIINSILNCRLFCIKNGQLLICTALEYTYNKLHL